MAKTRTPARNLKNNRRARVIKMVEAKLELKDNELSKLKPGADVKEYRAELTAHVAHLKNIQQAKGGTL